MRSEPHDLGDLHFRADNTPTVLSAECPFSLTARASFSDRWSIHTMMFLSLLGSSSSETDRGWPWSFNTTNEHVASKLIPTTRSLSIEPRASLTASEQLRQISSDDCSTKSPPLYVQVFMFRVALPRRLPAKSKTPARALPVPTSTPMTNHSCLRVLSYVASPSSRASACVGNGSANEIPLQNSSALLGSVVPIWLCRLRRVDVVFAGRCWGLLCLLCCAALREQTVLRQRLCIDRCDSCAAQSVIGASDRCALQPAAMPSPK